MGATLKKYLEAQRAQIELSSYSSNFSVKGALSTFGEEILIRT